MIINNNYDMSGYSPAQIAMLNKIGRLYNNATGDTLEVTDTIRPQNADYGSENSYHKSWDAVDLGSAILADKQKGYQYRQILNKIARQVTGGQAAEIFNEIDDHPEFGSAALHLGGFSKLGGGKPVDARQGLDDILSLLQTRQSLRPNVDERDLEAIRSYRPQNSKDEIASIMAMLPALNAGASKEVGANNLLMLKALSDRAEQEAQIGNAVTQRNLGLDMAQKGMKAVDPATQYAYSALAKMLGAQGLTQDDSKNLDTQAAILKQIMADENADKRLAFQEANADKRLALQLAKQNGSGAMKIGDANTVTKALTDWESKMNYIMKSQDLSADDTIVAMQNLTESYLPVFQSAGLARMVADKFDSSAKIAKQHKGHLNSTGKFTFPDSKMFEPKNDLSGLLNP